MLAKTIKRCIKFTNKIAHIATYVKLCLLVFVCDTVYNCAISSLIYSVNVLALLKNAFGEDKLISILKCLRKWRICRHVVEEVKRCRRSVRTQNIG